MCLGDRKDSTVSVRKRGAGYKNFLEWPGGGGQIHTGEKGRGLKMFSALEGDKASADEKGMYGSSLSLGGRPSLTPKGGRRRGEVALLNF